jgi:S-DNA-T family DNA segregation ATPase FtsK/SpoIIIE
MDEPLVIPVPPRMPERDSRMPAASGLLPMVGSVASIGVVAGMGGAGSRAMIGAGAFLACSLVMVLLQADRSHRRHREQVAEARADYVEQLGTVRATARAAASRQRSELLARHPATPAWLGRLAAGQATRGRDDPAYLCVRVGTGSMALSPSLVPPDEPALRKADPVLVDAVRRFAATHSMTSDLPRAVDLRATPRLRLGGDADQARALVCELIAAHTDVAVRVASDAAREWQWLRWVPQPARPRHTVVVAAGGELPEVAGPTSVLDLAAAADPGVGGDRCGVATAEAVARLVARRPPEEAPVRRRLEVEIGHDEHGDAVLLPLDEPARGGAGPHGFVVGATGSGKSELLRTIVLGLVHRHPPDDVNLLLVDFKGGATFFGLAELPHVAGLITNLADDLAHVDRMADALSGELARRQEVLSAAGGCTDREAYAAARATRADLEPLPSLVIVVDEFSELLSARPDFVDTFVAIGRLGRSLGLHLLLATQRLEEGRLRGLESHLGWRIALRTFSASESRAVIGVPDAHLLPSQPGLGLLRTGPDDLQRFQASLSPDLVGAGLDGPPARPIWLPPLGSTPPLDLDAQGRHALDVGTVDLPLEQRHAPLHIDLGGPGGHVAIVGGPRSGKSSLLATTLVALAAGASPTQRQLHVLDLGGCLDGIDSLPHLASRAGSHEPDLVRRIVRHLHSTLAEREAGATGPELVLAVDGWSALPNDHADLAASLQAVAARGLAHGVHLIVTAHRWSDVRLRDFFGSRLELRLGDPYESLVGRRAAGLVPRDRPGRGVTVDGHQFLAARVDDQAVDRVAARWPALPRLRSLPAQVGVETLPPCDRVRLGLAETGPVTLEAQHLVLAGPPGSGRTSSIRTVLAELVRTSSPARVQVVTVDARHSLFGEVPASHRLQQLTGGAAHEAIRELTAYLQGRLPGPDVSAAQLRDRSWWTGAELWLVVDDLDLLPAPNPLAPLGSLLPHAAEIGLHVVVAQRSGTRLPDPFASALLDLGATRIELRGAPPGRGELTGRASTGPVQVGWIPPAG